MKTKEEKDVLSGAMEIAQDIYNKVGGLEPMLSVDFKWAVDFTGHKGRKESRIGLLLSTAQMLADRIEISGRLGFVAAVLSKLKLTSEPENVLFVSEAWVSGDVSTRPSDDPKRKEAVIVAVMDKQEKLYTQINTIWSVYKETEDGNVYIQKQIDKNPVKETDTPDSAESPLLSAFWTTYRHTLNTMREESEILSHFAKVSSTDPQQVIEMVFRVSMEKYGQGDMYTGGISYEKNN